MLEIIREHWVAWIIPAGFALFFTITILIFDFREYEPIVQIWKWLNSLAESAFSFIAGDGSSPKSVF